MIGYKRFLTFFKHQTSSPSCLIWISATSPASTNMNQRLEENVNKDRKVCFIKWRNISTFLAFAMVSDYYMLNNQLLLEAQLFSWKIAFEAKGGLRHSVEFGAEMISRAVI